MRFRLALLDMDGVLVDTPSSWVTVHRHFGVDNSGNAKLFYEGKIDQLEFMRSDIMLWKAVKRDVSLKDLEELFSTVPMMPGCRETIAALKRQGMRTAIVSGGIDILAERIASATGIDTAVANGLEADSNGLLTGEGILRVDIKDKSKCASQIMREAGVGKDECIAVGDGPSDLSLFRSAGRCIAFNPWNSSIEAEADFVVRTKDLREILKFTGGDTI